MQQEYNIEINETQVGLRLDAVLTQGLPEFSRSKIQEYIKLGYLQIKQNDDWILCSSNNYKVKLGEQYKLSLIFTNNKQIKPLDLDLEILFEDEYLLIINKPANLTVHPGAGNKDHTLVNALVARLGNDLSSTGGDDRQGIVHRLDKNTSGVMIIAKTDLVHRKLSEQFAVHSIKRNYRALVWGIIKPLSGTINNVIGRSNTNRKKMAVLTGENRGKRAITIYNTLKISDNKLFSLVDCELQTGRTHQIRVHLSNIGHNVIGDSMYGSKKTKIFEQLNSDLSQKLLNLNRQALHAYYLEFIHPITEELMSFNSNEPAELQEIYDLIFND
ncbi:RluA family pseudouridine synthase [Rickettsiales bacterium LUAb2]